MGAGQAFSSPAEAIMAFDRKAIDLQSPIKVRVTDRAPASGDKPEGWEPGSAWLAETTLGRVLFNDLLPDDYPFINEPMPKKRQAAIVNDLAERYPMVTVARTLDKLKDAGFLWATRSGVTIAISDVVVPAKKQDDSRRVREEGGRGREALPAWSAVPHGAQQRAGQGLGPGDRGGRPGHGGQLPGRPTRSR